MMAVGLIEALKAVEERFGAEDHDVVRGALARTGDRILSEMGEGVDPPEDATPPEVTSAPDAWDEYSERLRERALKIVDVGPRPSPPGRHFSNDPA